MQNEKIFIKPTPGGKSLDHPSTTVIKVKKNREVTHFSFDVFMRFTTIATERKKLKKGTRLRRKGKLER